VVSREGDVIKEVYPLEYGRTQNGPMSIFVRWKVVLCILFIFIKFLLNIIFGMLDRTLFSFSFSICLYLTNFCYFLSFH